MIAQSDDIQKKDSAFTVNFTKISKISHVKLKHRNSDLLNDFLKKKQLKRQVDSFRLPYSALAIFLKDFSSYLITNGYAFSKVTLQNIVQKEDMLVADLNIDLGKQVLIDDIILKGYDEFSKKKLLRLLNIKKKTVLNEALIETITKQLKSISYVEMIRKPEVLYAPDATKLYVYLKKRASSQLDGLVAFSTEDNGKLKLNGDFNLSLNNVFNNAETLKLEWQSSETRRNLTVNVDFPYVFDSNFMLSSNFGIQRADTSFVNVNFRTKLGYQLSKLNTLNFVGVIENSNTSSDLIPSGVLDYQKFQFGLGYVLQKLSNNHLLDNIKTQFAVEAQLGTRKTSSQSENQQVYSLIFKHLLSLNARNYIWIRSNNVFLNTNNTLQNEFFPIGGFSSLRGFREQEILTSKYSVNNLEYHFLIGEKSYFYGLIDGGIYYEEQEENYETPYAIGLGYALANKQSMLNFSYAIAKQNNQRFDLSNAKFHLKLAYLF